MTGVTDDDVAVGHGAGIGDPIDEPGVVGDRQRTRGETTVPGCEHAHRDIGKTAQSGVQQPVVGVLGGGGSHEDERSIAGWEGDILGGRLPHERSDDVEVGGPCARVLELRECGDERELSAGAAVDVGERRQANPLASVVERAAPALEPSADRQVGSLPERPTSAGAGEAGTKGVDGESRGSFGKHVGDERGKRDAGELTGKRGAESEDVVYDDIRAQLAH